MTSTTATATAADTTHHKIGSDLYLIRQPITKTASARPATTAPPAVHHVLVIDCSGSMSGDLPRIREQLKKKLPKLLKEGDVVSVIWFSGKGQHGVLFEAEPVPTLADLKDINAAIDRWLKPIGLTGFKEPLEDAQTVIARVTKNLKSHSPHLVFLSDGCDNQWDRNLILGAIDKLVSPMTGTSVIASATFVEYGYYADRAFLAKMAERAGGSHIFAEDFDRYDPIFDSTITKRSASAKRVEVEIPKAADPIGGFVFTMHDGDLLTFSLGATQATTKAAASTIRTIHVAEGLSEIAYLSPTPIGTPGLTCDELADSDVGLPQYADKRSVNLIGWADSTGAATTISLAYAALSLFSVRMKPEIIFPILKALGDVKFIHEFSNCFGKQRYSAFMDATKAAAFNTSHRFTAGRDPSLIPPDDAFTILDLLQILQEDDGNRILLDHPAFQYSRISRHRVDADPANALKFTPDQYQAKDGYPISSLVWNEDRPNVSFMVRKEGTVDLTNLTATPPVAGLPGKFPTWIFRNYAIVKDGLVNIDVLPVKLTEATIRKLFDIGKAAGRDCAVSCIVNQDLNIKTSVGRDPNDPWLIDLKSLPIINRKMIKSASAKKLFEDEYELTKRRAAQKVFNTYKKEKFPKESKGYAIVYGEQAATWLKDLGLTDYNGFSPKQVQAEAKDFYMGKELTVSLKGLSSLPSLREVNEKRSSNSNAKKLTPSAALMVPAIQEVEAFLDSATYKKAKDKDKDKVFEAWLTAQSIAATSAVRSILGEMARTKFAVVIGQTWFTEFDSLEQNSMSLATSDAGTIECKVTMREVEIHI